MMGEGQPAALQTGPLQTDPQPQGGTDPASLAPTSGRRPSGEPGRDKADIQRSFDAHSVASLRWDRACLGAGLAAWALGTWYVLGGPARPFLHWLASLVCHGTSTGKPAFLFGFVGAFCLIVSRPRSRASRSTIAMFALTVSIGLGLTLALATFVQYALTHGLAWGWFSFQWHDGVNSVNTLAHIHTSKSGLARALDALGLERLHTRFDTGAAYTASVHPVLSWGVLTCFLISTLLALTRARELVDRAQCAGSRVPSRPDPRKLEAERHLERLPRLALALPMGVAFGALCKSILDGGPLAYDAVAAALAVWMFAGTRALGTRRRLAIAALALSAWLIVLELLAPASVRHQLERSIAHFGLYALLPLCALARPTQLRAASAPERPLSAHDDRSARMRHSRARWARAGALLALTIIAIHAMSSARRGLIPLLAAAPDHARVFTWGPPGTLGQGCGPECTHVALDQGTLLEAYRSLGDDAFRVRRTSLTTDRRASGLLANLKVLDGPRSMLLPRGGIVEVRRIEPEPELGAGWLRIDVGFDAQRGPAAWGGEIDAGTQVDENERFLAFHALDAYLRSAGITRYILVPHGAYVEPTPDDDHALAKGTTPAESR